MAPFVAVREPEACAQGGAYREQAEREALARRPANYRGCPGLHATAQRL
jgi:hypothetical protein